MTLARRRRRLVHRSALFALGAGRPMGRPPAGPAPAPL